MTRSNSLAFASFLAAAATCAAQSPIQPPAAAPHTAPFSLTDVLELYAQVPAAERREGRAPGNVAFSPASIRRVGNLSANAQAWAQSGGLQGALGQPSSGSWPALAGAGITIPTGPAPSPRPLPSLLEGLLPASYSNSLSTDTQSYDGVVNQLASEEANAPLWAFPVRSESSSWAPTGSPVTLLRANRRLLRTALVEGIQVVELPLTATPSLVRDERGPSFQLRQRRNVVFRAIVLPDSGLSLARLDQVLAVSPIDVSLSLLSRRAVAQRFAGRLQAALDALALTSVNLSFPALDFSSQQTFARRPGAYVQTTRVKLGTAATPFLPQPGTPGTEADPILPSSDVAIDRPFLFLVVDTDTHEILSFGRVIKP